MGMDEIVDHIRSHVESSALISAGKDLQRSGCRLSMQGISTRKFVLVDVDRVTGYRFVGKRCDFVLFLEHTKGDLIVSPIELKNTRIEPSAVNAQLQGGANYASSIVPSGIRCRCVPIVIYGKAIHPIQRRSLNKKRVIFQKYRRIIRTVKCNRDGNLLSAISQSL